MLRDEAKSILEPKLQGRMKSSKTKWKLRIVGYGEEAPEKILSNPYNYRLHPKSQHDALRTVLNDSGIVQTVIINKTTGRLIDGHLRVELARREKQPSIPVTYVELTEEEEKKILSVLDPITSMATQDQDKLYTLIKDIGNSLPQELLTALHGKVALPVDSSLQMEDHNLGVTDAVYQLREDAIFPSSNEWDIPDLREDMLGDVIPTEVYDGVNLPDKPEKTVVLWNRIKPEHRQYLQGSTLAFYMHDEEFESVWIDAVRQMERIKSFGYGQVIAPDFSLWLDLPRAFQIYNTYRRQWCARYWQEVGIKVIPSLNWSSKDSLRFSNAGIPKNCPLVSVQCRTTGTKQGKINFLWGIRYSLEEIRPKACIIYGGNEHRAWLKELPEGIDYVFLPSWTELRRQRVFPRGTGRP